MIYLEDPEVGETAETVMISSEEVDSLKMYCRGSDNCCGRETNRICDEGEAGGAGVRMEDDYE